MTSCGHAGDCEFEFSGFLVGPLIICDLASTVINLYLTSYEYILYIIYVYI